MIEIEGDILRIEGAVPLPIIEGAAVRLTDREGVREVNHLDLTNTPVHPSYKIMTKLTPIFTMGLKRFGTQIRCSGLGFFQEG